MDACGYSPYGREKATEKPPRPTTLGSQGFQVIAIGRISLFHESSSLAFVEQFLGCKRLNNRIMGIERTRFQICLFETEVPTRLAHRSVATPIVENDGDRTIFLFTTTDRTILRVNSFAESVFRTVCAWNNHCWT